ncbi:unnamed protein product [Amoebophrya sp. A120]|nr:unnamed protein product [Amoebophrya sp. A120]|eukprot:GSA120T00013722001.1
MVLIEEVESPKAADRKAEGNGFFAKSQWSEAIQSFSEGIKKIHDKSLDDPSVLYSNRAMCHMKLADWKSALTDSNDAIRMNKHNAKAWNRKGQCLMKLGRLEDAKKAYEMSLTVATDALRPSILETIEELEEMLKSKGIVVDGENSTSASETTTTASSAATPQPAEKKQKIEPKTTTSTASTSSSTSSSSGTSTSKSHQQQDFAHPSLQIQYIPQKGRGIITKNKIKKGALLISARPVCIALKSDMKEKMNNLAHNSNDLTEETARLVLQLHNDSSNNTIKQQVLKRDDLPIPPSVDRILMRNSGNDFRTKPVSTDTASRLTPKVISEILEANTFGFDDGDALQNATDKYSGLWLLPSFINHSCLSNVNRRVLWKKEGTKDEVDMNAVMEIRAGRDLEVGEELCFTYCPTTQPLHLREKSLESYGFKPQDTRCKLERMLLKESFAADITAETNKLGQALGGETFAQIYSKYVALRIKLETKLKEIVNSEDATKAILTVDRTLSKATLYNWFCASFTSVFAAQAMLASQIQEADSAYLHRKAAMIVASVFPACPYEAHFLKGAGDLEEAQFVFGCVAGMKEPQFVERYPETKGKKYDPTPVLEWETVDAEGQPPLYILEIPDCKDSSTAKVSLSATELCIKVDNKKERYCCLPVDANYLLGAEPVAKSKTELVITMGVNRVI